MCDFILHGVSDDNSGKIQAISLKNNDYFIDGGNITYLVPAHRLFYFVYFEVNTAAGVVNISSDNFSKIVTKYKLKTRPCRTGGTILEVVRHEHPTHALSHAHLFARSRAMGKM